MPNILFTFETEQQRDQFLRFLTDLPESLLLNEEPPIDIKTILNKIEIETTQQRQCTLWISGKKIQEGPAELINKIFNQEIQAHSASVEIREQRNGKWFTTRSRKNQLIQT